ncbi:MAG: hypothetical protein HY368_01540 [Candidatus Aenigmarchaeota archaeon]|nr:hypothetical protein [Candidatus Aenigmarchaeota archaeon]
MDYAGKAGLEWKPGSYAIARFGLEGEMLVYIEDVRAGEAYVRAYLPESTPRRGTDIRGRSWSIGQGSWMSRKPEHNPWKFRRIQLGLLLREKDDPPQRYPLERKAG